MSQQYYQQRDVLRVYPYLKSRTLMSWIRDGLFEPAVYQGGSGHHREYSWENLVQIGVIRELKETGIQHIFVKHVLDILSPILHELRGDPYWVLAGIKQHTTAPGDYIFEARAIRWADVSEQTLCSGSAPNKRKIGVQSIILISLQDIIYRINKVL